MEATESMEGSTMTVVEMLWPMPLLLSVSVEAGWRLGRLTEPTEPTELTKLMVVEMLWPLLLLLSVSVEAGWRS